MKKSVKIIMGIFLALVVIIGATALFLKSKGFFKHLSTPEIVSIEITDSNPLSLKEINKGFDEFDDGEKKEESYCHIKDMNAAHEYTVTLSDGREIAYASNNPIWIQELDEAHSVIIDAYIKRSDVEKALKKEKNTVPVYIEAELYKGDFDEPVYVFECETEKQFTQAVVKSIEPLFDSPLTMDESYSYKLEERKFRVTYADGTVKELSPVRVNNMLNAAYYERYTLDGEMLAVQNHFNYDLEGNIEVTVEFFEEETKFEVIAGEQPVIKEIKFTDISLPDGTEKGTVSFQVAKDDGTTEEFTSEFSKDAFTGYVYIGKIYGCRILMYAELKKGNVIITPNIDGEIGAEQTFTAPDGYKVNTPVDLEYAGATAFSILHYLFNK